MSRGDAGEEHANLFRVGERGGVAVGGDDAGGKRVEGDAVAAVRDGRVANDVVEGRLRGGIGDEPRGGAEVVDAADDEDPPPPFCAHGGQKGLDELERGGDIDLKLPRELLRLELLD